MTELRDEDLDVVTGCLAAHPNQRGGQHVAMHCTAVLVIHVPTGIAVRVDDERSQHRCREKALERLREVLDVWSRRWDCED